MKILFIIQRLQLRGAEIFACQLASELNAIGFEVEVAYLFEGPTLLKNKFNALRFIPLQGNQQSRFVDFRAYRKLSVLIKDSGYDLIQANAGDTLKYAALSKLIYTWKAPLIYRNANKMSAFIRGKFHLMLNRYFISACDYFISVSENCRRDLVEYLLPAAANRSTTITIGTYLFDDVVSATRTQKGPIFINVGSLVPEKNHILLLDIFSQYFEKHHRGVLWIVGDGPLREVLENKVAVLGLVSNVIFFGYQDNVIMLLKSADVMVMPSLVEGLPGVILEALSCKVPVVASAVGGIPEVIISDRTGYSVQGFDPSAYVDKMEKILTDHTLRDQLATEGRAMIESKYLMPQVANQFALVYHQLVTKRA